MRLHPTFLLSMASLVLLAPLASATISYTVTVNTSSQLGNAGFIDLQFDPSTLPGTAAAAASVMDFAGPVDPTNISTSGDVTGTLSPATSVMFDNGSSFNDYQEGITAFANQITFMLTLSGPAISSPANAGGGTTFAVDFINAAQTQYLFTDDPDGNTATGYFVVLVVINPDGTITTIANPGPNGGPSLATIAPAMSQAPEPSTSVLLAGGLIGIAELTRRRTQRGS